MALIDAASSQQDITLVQGALQVLTALQLTANNYPEQKCIYDGASFDYIVVGAGTAGCAVARRLAEDKITKVLLLEAGDDPQLESDLPALLLYLNAGDSSWKYKVQDPDAGSASHKPIDDDLSLGKVLGGSSSLSYLIYSSGNRQDYDDWARIVNDSTWSWENVLPYLKKSQRLADQQLLASDSEFYGQNGNIGLTVLRDAGTIRSAPYFKGFQEAGNNIVPSVNGNISLGYSSAIFTIENGMRQNTAFGYLVPDDLPNLTIVKNAWVKKVVFDGCKRAIGVELEACNKRYLFVSARKEVILSAGIVNTPKILLLSGIGPRKQLCDLKISTVSNLPVGKGFQDHLGVALVYNMTKLVVPRRPFKPEKYPATVILGYAAVNDSDKYPLYQSVNFVNFPAYLMNYCTFTYYYKDSICNNMIKTTINSQMMFSVINLQKTLSRGEIRLKTGDYRDDPLIFAGYYSNPKDLEDHARAVQDFVRVGQTESFKNLGAELKDPKLPQCGEMDMEDFEYVKCYVQYMMTSQHQYSSTCQMGTVVDYRLRVNGVKRLRVVDASIMPNPTAGGTLGPTIMIGEKAADMIKEDNA